MALIKFGMMMTDARGKLGGHVFTKARNGATIRTKVSPANPQTPAQSLSRSIFATVSSTWRTLEESARVAWNAAVNDYSRTNVFGDNYLPSGKNLFTQLNCNLLNVGLPIIQNPPSPLTFDGIFVADITVINADTEITPQFPNGTPGIEYIKVMEASKPFSAGKFNFSGAYSKVAQWSSATPLTPAQLYTAYVFKYGVPATDQKIAFRFYVISIDTGQKSQYTNATTIVR